MKLTNEFQSIREWAENKGIFEKGDVKTQYVKLQEEAGELAKAIIKEDYEEFIDAIGDCVVVLTNLAELGNKFFETTEDYYEDVAGDGGSKMLISGGKITIEECINSAYNVIAKRKGKMINGSFVKNN
jgi:NTP pyrophosphatase (non-canonical NTP hydrolase)